jgi:hypothetical protein
LNSSGGAAGRKDEGRKARRRVKQLRKERKEKWNQRVDVG